MTVKTLEINWAHLWPIVNILNEVCHGVHIESFESTIGYKYDSVLMLLDKLAVHEKSDDESDVSMKIDLSNKEIDIIKNSYREVLKQIEEWEFQTRIGVTKAAIDKVILKLA